MKKVFLTALVSGWVAVAGADVFTFDFTTGSGSVYDFDALTGQITTNGITMKFTAIVDGGDAGAQLNSTAGYFGINATGSDETDKLDPGEAISITFSSSLYTSLALQNIRIGAWTKDPADSGYYQIDGGDVVGLASLDNSVNPAVDILGKKLTVKSLTGNGISLNEITVKAIPEPETMSLIGLSGLCVLLARRIRLRR